MWFYQFANLSLTIIIPVFTYFQNDEIQEAISLGADFLANYYHEIEDPFEMPIVTYALQTAGTGLSSELAYLKLRSQRRTSQSMKD